MRRGWTGRWRPGAWQRRSRGSWQASSAALGRWLREGLALTPAPIVTALAERRLDEDHGPRTAPATPAVPLSPCLAAASRRPVVGREPELARLLAACREACDGHSPV